MCVCIFCTVFAVYFADVMLGDEFAMKNSRLQVVCTCALPACAEVRGITGRLETKCVEFSYFSTCTKVCMLV